MSCLRANISKILTWSCVDGPGNRMVLFLQGCNFDCIACHNPHTIGVCNHCGDCVPACPTNALSMVDDKVAFDTGQCTQCDACLEACPIKASPMAQSYSVAEILDLLHQHLGFVSGITVSGGEATMQLPFVKSLFTGIGRDPELRRLTRFIDTNGYLGPDSWRALLDVTDGVMLDIKAFDADIHNRLTGRDNARSLASARLLSEAGKLYELRYLMVPGETDSENEIENLRDFALSLRASVRLRLNTFRTHGVRGESADWPVVSQGRAEAAAAVLEQAGLGPVALPSLW